MNLLFLIHVIIQDHSVPAPPGRPASAAPLPNGPSALPPAFGAVLGGSRSGSGSGRRGARNKYVDPEGKKVSAPAISSVSSFLPPAGLASAGHPPTLMMVMVILASFPFILPLANKFL
jgi:hypothetical protein